MKNTQDGHKRGSIGAKLLRDGITISENPGFPLGILNEPAGELQSQYETTTEQKNKKKQRTKTNPTYPRPPSAISRLHAAQPIEDLNPDPCVHEGESCLTIGVEQGSSRSRLGNTICGPVSAIRCMLPIQPGSPLSSAPTPSAAALPREDDGTLLFGVSAFGRLVRVGRSLRTDLTNQHAP
ncbi:hypothetical protein NDU88_000665 [Pleurodeles waltl]|uniref:Uncharacterized protein n=1 Tax=Pleurodeles waltl TaxID=8319 RepID=A0AAV7P1Y7_PLEWA|nr:hypothetical protein NDU88_000665 [Pleurodeles waltl]